MQVRDDGGGRDNKLTANVRWHSFIAHSAMNLCASTPYVFVNFTITSMLVLVSSFSSTIVAKYTNRSNRLEYLSVALLLLYLNEVKYRKSLSSTRFFLSSKYVSKFHTIDFNALKQKHNEL